MPVDGGPAYDLRASAASADSARQLTGLFAAAHRPDARAWTLFEEFIFSCFLFLPEG